MTHVETEDITKALDRDAEAVQNAFDRGYRRGFFDFLLTLALALLFASFITKVVLKP